jgi:hypothetical protein
VLLLVAFSLLPVLNTTAAATYSVNDLECPDTIITLTGGSSTSPVMLTPLDDTNIPGFDTSGTTLLLGPGEYLIDASIELPAVVPALCIIGQGGNRSDVVLRTTAAVTDFNDIYNSFLQSGSSTLGLAGLMIDGGGEGSGFYVRYTSDTDTRLEFEDLTARNLLGYGGGAVYLENGVLNAVDVRFENNSANPGDGLNQGGAVWCRDPLEMTSQFVTFTAVSQAVPGGGGDLMHRQAVP